MYVAGNNHYSFFLLLKYTEALKRESHDPLSAGVRVLTVQPEEPLISVNEPPLIFPQTCLAVVPAALVHLGYSNKNATDFVIYKE